MNPADLRRAAAFYAIAKAGGVTAAARTIGKSPPAVHADLRRFERSVGAVLVERFGRGMRLTPSGRILYEAVGRAFAELDRAAGEVAAGNFDSPLRIGAVPGFGRYVLADRLLAALPVKRRMVLRTGSHDQLVEMLAAGEVDLIVSYRPVIAAPFECEAVAIEQLGLIAPSGLESFDPHALAAGRWVTYEEYEFVFAKWFAAVLGHQPEHITRGDHHDELEEAFASVRAGRGYTIAPVEAVGPGLVVLGTLVSNSVYLCGSRQRMRSDDSRLLRQILATCRD
ncbi:LysR family transcriptional regulator [Sphingomonas panacisoli]|uniref:LysR family transcriptional regulator n=1 Tax=Sphingomonas panacisoli TaxID=1813879 RepID=A0A5B8LG25_9SPHN|nr:LysR family transcriptional regulator [Sphingomonas panacisoli]QDZ06715.1 LysR family transcriptional regulator [Sphingomonas panacisoli]